MPNYNPDTGIAYGVIAVNSLSEEIRDTIYAAATNWDCPELDTAYKECQRDRVRELIMEWEITAMDLPDFDHTTPFDGAEGLAYVALEYLTDAQIGNLIDEFDPDFAQMFYDGLDEGEFRKHGTIHDDDFGDFKVSMVNLGGAPLLWIEDSPIQVMARRCSPCIPGAGDLDATMREAQTLLNFNNFGRYIPCYGIPEIWYAKPAE